MALGTQRSRKAYWWAMMMTRKRYNNETQVDAEGKGKQQLGY